MSSTNGMVLQTGNYQPFSYDELVKPIDNMTKMQMAQEDAINKLEQQSSTLDKYVNDKDTPYASALYDKMKLNLKQQLTIWQDKGLTSGNQTECCGSYNPVHIRYSSNSKLPRQRSREQVKNYMDNQNKTPDISHLMIRQRYHWMISFFIQTGCMNPQIQIQQER